MILTRAEIVEVLSAVYEGTATAAQRRIYWSVVEWSTITRCLRGGTNQ